PLLFFLNVSPSAATLFPYTTLFRSRRRCPPIPRSPTECGSAVPLPTLQRRPRPKHRPRVARCRALPEDHSLRRDTHSHEAHYRDRTPRHPTIAAWPLPGGPLAPPCRRWAHACPRPGHCLRGERPCRYLPDRRHCHPPPTPRRRPAALNRLEPYV